MKNLIVIILVAVIGFGLYKQFFDKGVADQVADELHASMPMIDKGVLKSCAEEAMLGLSDSQKAELAESLSNGGKIKKTNMTEAMEQMQHSMNFMGELMECVNLQ